LKFTCEIEEDGKLAFLDVMILKNENGSLGHSVYRKPTHTDKYLNFISHHHRCQKLAVIDSLAFRAFKLCDENHLLHELEHIKKVLIMNGYPIALINQRIEVMKNRVSRNAQNEKSTNWCAIPFVGDVTYRIGRIIRKELEVNLGYYTGKKLSTYFLSHKDKYDKEKLNCGVYRIKSSRCSGW